MTLFLTQVDIRGDRYPDVETYPFNIPPLAGRQTLGFRRGRDLLRGRERLGEVHLHAGAGQEVRRTVVGTAPTGSLPPARSRSSALSEYLDPTLTTHSFSGGFFSAEGFRDWAEFLDDVARIDPGQARYQGGPELTARSHGQGILEYFRCRYQVPGLYFLDEPESALSPASQVELLRLLASCGECGHAQFLIATHSPILMALPGSLLLDFEGTGIVERPYEATEHFRLYRDFLSDPGAYLAARSR